MKARVYKHNPNNQYVALESVNNPNVFSIIQLKTGELLLEDLVEWGSEYNMGLGRIYNHRTSSWCAVVFENHDVSKGSLMDQLRIAN